eukprot:gene25459-27621_t
MAMRASPVGCQNSVEPQVAQKPRVASGEEPYQLTLSAPSISTASSGAPWQAVTGRSGPVARQRTLPQRHEPVSAVVIAQSPWRAARFASAGVFQSYPANPRGWPLTDQPKTATAAVECPHCGKIPALCVCAEVTPIDNRVELLVLQHPQEQDKTLGSARLAVHHLTKADFRVGLSWPSLAKALGRPEDPKHWAILHLGSITAEDFPEGRDLA